MKIALFSDVHGHLRILLRLIRNWQIAHSSHVDAALIAGDLGCFPDTSKFDRATKRWIDRDPEEAGFAKYFTTPLPEVERLFEPEFGEFLPFVVPFSLCQETTRIMTTLRPPADRSLPKMHHKALSRSIVTNDSIASTTAQWSPFMVKTTPVCASRAFGGSKTPARTPRTKLKRAPSNGSGNGNGTPLTYC